MKLSQLPNERPLVAQKQKLRLTDDVKQGLQVLQMSMMELRGYLQEQSWENPFLDLQEPPEISLEASPAKESGDEEQERPASSYEDRIFAKQGAEYRPELLAGRRGEPDKLADALHEQLDDLHLSESERALCGYLIASLDDHGFLQIPIEEIAGECRVSTFSAMQSLFILQSMEPAGVGARSLSECLLLQLAAGPDFNAYTVKTVKSGLRLLAQNDMTKLARLLSCSVAKAQETADLVRRLNPYPARGYSDGEEIGYVVPDAEIESDAQGVRVVLNSAAVPKLELNREYCALLEQSVDPAAKKYLREKQRDAGKLVRAVRERQATLQRLLAFIVDYQSGFFKEGKDLQPILQSEAAARLGVHSSTVSRAVRNKYIRCKSGTILLKDLFTVDMSQNAEAQMSKSMLLHRLKGLLAQEDVKNPFTDDALQKELSAAGFQVSRRTVAKYREMLAIPKASLRRRYGEATSP